MFSRIFSVVLVLLIVTSAASNAASYSSVLLLQPSYSTSAKVEEPGSRIQVSEISIPEIDVNATSSTTASVGQPLTLSVSIFNFEVVPVRFHLTLEIRSVEGNGVTHAAFWQPGQLDSFLHVEDVTMPWTPSRAGNYELRSFAVFYSGNENSTSIIEISPIKTRVITVEPSSLCLPVSAAMVLSGEANHVLPVQSVIANSYEDPYFPHNVSDGNLTTRWSGGDESSWVLLDLGRQSALCSVEVAWHSGGTDQSTSSFAISASNDGDRFVDVYVGRSSNTSLSFDRYQIDEIEGRFVKITVYGSNVEGKELAGISEVVIHGFPQSVNDDDINNGTNSRPALEIISPLYGEIITGPPETLVVNVTGSVYSSSGISEVLVRIDRHSYEPASLEQVGNGTVWTISKSVRLDGFHTITTKATDIHGRSNWESVPIDVLFDYETGNTDQFGVQKIYQTKEGGEEWYMNMINPFSDPRFISYATLTLNEDDGSWKVADGQVRLDVATSSGYHPERIVTYSQQQLEAKGYMQDANDWKNVEITGFVRVNEATIDDGFSWYARGGKHTDIAPCEGTSYKSGLYYSGRARVAKEQWHAGGYSFTEFLRATTSLHDRWIGFKAAIYNNEDSGSSTNVVIETWINENANKVTWKKVSETVDSGNWGSEGDYCNGSPDQVITWGGPIAAFRWDNADDVDVKWLSVREIEVNEDV